VAETTETREEASPEADGASAPEAGADLAVRPRAIADAIPTVAPSHPIEPPAAPETIAAEPGQDEAVSAVADSVSAPEQEEVSPLKDDATLLEETEEEPIEPLQQEEEEAAPMQQASIPPPQEDDATLLEAAGEEPVEGLQLEEEESEPPQEASIDSREASAEPPEPSALEPAGAPEPEENPGQEDQTAPPAEPWDAAAENLEVPLLVQSSPAPIEPPAPEPHEPPPQPTAQEPESPPWPETTPEPRVPADPPPAVAHEVVEVPPPLGIADALSAPTVRQGIGDLSSTIAEPPRQAAAPGGEFAFVRAETVAPVAPVAMAASTPTVALPSPGDGLDRAWPYLRLALKAVAVVVAGLATLVLLLVVLYRWFDPPTSTLMLSQRLAGTQIEHRWAPLRRISPNLVRAVVLSEDGGFCRHRGVDWRALEAAVETGRGGSTITMQVVKNLFLWPSRSYVRKAIEIALAYLVDAFWPKERILEVYLNIAEWGDGVFGAEAAARHHFRTSAAQLTAQQAALLAVSLPNPIEREAGAPGPQARRLAANLLVRMRAARSATACVRMRSGPP
jgi:monofunctional glycosyltransferase